MSRFKKANSEEPMNSDKFDPSFIDPVGLSDKDIYPDINVNKKSKYDPKFIDPVGLSDKDVYPDVDLMSLNKKKKPSFKIRRVK